ncbi:hypothetical protein [Niastella koreensis]|nr:hypothetical protein [Niastella koreensis]
MGFETPAYFSRLFKKEVGVSPNVFRSVKKGTVHLSDLFLFY